MGLGSYPCDKKPAFMPSCGRTGRVFFHFTVQQLSIGRSCATPSVLRLGQRVYCAYLDQVSQIRWHNHTDSFLVHQHIVDAQSGGYGIFVTKSMKRGQTAALSCQDRCQGHVCSPSSIPAWPSCVALVSAQALTSITP